MPLNSFLYISSLIFVSFAVAYLVLWTLSAVSNRKSRRQVGFMLGNHTELAFLFEDESLINATSEAKLVLATAASGQSDLMRLLSVFAPKFPGLAEGLRNLADIDTLNLQSNDGFSRLNAEWRDGLARICIKEEVSGLEPAKLDVLSLAAMEQEIETLRATSEDAPFLVWRQQKDGTIVWANNTYLELAKICDSESPASSWPPPKLFDAEKFQDSDIGRKSRLTLHVSGEVSPRWFECVQTNVGSDHLFTAVSADSLVNAEVSLRDFVQTLTKTFAHLPTGLAIFDKQRRLTLFNPALTYLTLLEPEFLSSRPTLYEVLDRLREKRMIPEPKNYKTWRQKMQDLEVGAVEGTYEETWSLASGQTYRVVGRPHPDGAVAFLFEDISAEISLTRRYRAELETGQAVIDNLDEAIAVFSADGSLTLSNAAYASLWGNDPAESLTRYGILEATKSWGENCAPTPVWGDVREFVGSLGERSEWTAEVQAKNGQPLQCRFSPISKGCTLVGFNTPSAIKIPAKSPSEIQPKISEGSLAG